MLNVHQSRVAAESGARPRRGVVVLYGHSDPAGTPAPLVAEWAGHTVEVLLRI
jgi:hypothetical protein